MTSCQEQLPQKDITMMFGPKSKFLGKLGEGSYGKVYKIQNEETKEMSAVKVFKNYNIQDGVPGTTLREISLLKRFQDYENIVQIKSVHPLKDEIHIELEYCDMDLNKFIRTYSGNTDFYNPDLIKRIMHQILNGVSQLHAGQVIHRDLKPGNILIKDGAIKIADFGLARMFDLPDQPYTQGVSTLWYRAPELFIGIPIYSHQIDSWAVGCIFGELICKEPLFPFGNDLGMVQGLVRTFGNFTSDVSILPGVNLLDFSEGNKEIFSKISVIGLDGLLRQKAKIQITPEMFDLLSKLLNVNPCERISCIDALKHPYFSN